MSIQRFEAEYEALPKDALERWRTLAPAIVSDCINRTQVMAGAIKPVKAGTRLAGQARTVKCMVGDNSAVHTAIPLMRAGEVLVVDGGGYADTALWGGIMTRAALKQGIAGLVIDGAVRDIAEIRELGFPVFSRAVVPAGPHKGWGGVIDGPIACGGCPVRPGDLVIGDDDGVCVVPLERAESILAASLEKVAQEEKTNANTARGELPVAGMGLPAPELIGK